MLNKNKFTLIGLLIVLTTFYFLLIFNKKVLPVLLTYAEVDATKITTDFINEAIKKKLNALEVEEVIEMVMNKDGEIISVDFNTNAINKNLYLITNEIQKNIKSIEKFNSNYIKKDGAVYYIPSGVASGLPVISNIGPKIPIQTYMTGNVVSNIKTEISEYGINNALLKVNVQVQTRINIVLPFVSKESDIIVDIPIAMKVIQGKIPQVYGGLFSTSSQLYGLTS